MKVEKCRYCGKDIIFIKNRKGHFIPCDYILDVYRADERGTVKIMTLKGETMRATPDRKEGTIGGYLCHKESCIGNRKKKR